MPGLARPAPRDMPSWWFPSLSLLWTYKVEAMQLPNFFAFQTLVRHYSRSQQFSTIIHNASLQMLLQSRDGFSLLKSLRSLLKYIHKSSHRLSVFDRT